ncbi:hypothetical protein PT974_05382 [Cladobotryum mycophilum]|uniref:F-box domain-containing protein n=1 Tax=Cladobotryum mycophilum TaxID=491253 RepID=A0ABR0SJT4_9HYPO
MDPNSTEAEHQEPAIYRLPAEMWSEVVGNCDVETLDVLSKVSKECRQQASPALFERIKFIGTDIRLYRCLGDLFSRPEEPATAQILLSVKQATLEIHASFELIMADKETFPMRNGVPYKLSRCLVQFIQSMRNLRVLWLQFPHSFVNQRHNFIDWLRLSRPWQLNNLRLVGDEEVVTRMIQHCVPGTLEALHIDSPVGSAAYRAAAQHHGGIKWLHLLLANGGDESLMFIPDMTTRTLRRIAVDFAQLEWLIIDDRNLTCSRNIGLGTIHDVFMRIMSRRFPNLTRLAFTFRVRWLSRVMLRHRFGDPRRDKWYPYLMHRIANALPNLRELVMFRKYPQVYRGFREFDGEETVVKPETIDMTLPETMFPLGLVESSPPEADPESFVD